MQCDIYCSIFAISENSHVFVPHRYTAKLKYNLLDILRDHGLCIHLAINSETICRQLVEDNPAIPDIKGVRASHRSVSGVTYCDMHGIPGILWSTRGIKDGQLRKHIISLRIKLVCENVPTALFNGKRDLIHLKLHCCFC
jgi:hypothetical protein